MRRAGAALAAGVAGLVLLTGCGRGPTALDDLHEALADLDAAVVDGDLAEASVLLTTLRVRAVDAREAGEITVAEANDIAGAARRLARVLRQESRAAPSSPTPSASPDRPRTTRPGPGTSPQPTRGPASSPTPAPTPTTEPTGPTPAPTPTAELTVPTTEPTEPVDEGADPGSE